MADESRKIAVVVEAQLSQPGISWPRIAADLGYHTVFLSNDVERYKKLPNFAPMLCADDVTVVAADTNSAEGILSAVSALPDSGQVRALYTQCDYNVAIVSEAAATLALPGLSPGAARLARHKLHARQAYLAAGVPAPAFAHATTEREAEAAIAAVGMPCVVKPMTESASTDVALCRDLADVFAAITRQPWDRRGQARTPGILMEEYCQGYEVSVETVTVDGEVSVIAVIDKSLGPHPYFTEIGHIVPSCLPAPVTGELADVARAALKAIGHDFGAAHTEIRMTAAGPRLIEVNARLCGADLPDLIEAALGIRLRHEVLAMHAGHSPRLAAQFHRGAATRRFTSPRTGVLRDVKGVPEARDALGVVDVTFDVRPGDAVESAVSNHEVLGHLRTAANTPAEAMRMAEAAASNITFVIE
jgi:biotin carboxylase